MASRNSFNIQSEEMLITQLMQNLTTNNETINAQTDRETFEVFEIFSKMLYFCGTLIDEDQVKCAANGPNAKKPLSKIPLIFRNETDNKESHIMVEKDSGGESSIQIHSDSQKDTKDTNMKTELNKCVDIDINEILNLLWPGLIDEPKVLDSFLYIFEEKSDITESKMEEILKTLEKEYSDLGSNYKELKVPTDTNGSNLKIKIGEMKNTKNSYSLHSNFILSSQETYNTEDIKKDIQKINDSEREKENMQENLIIQATEQPNSFNFMTTEDIEMGLDASDMDTLLEKFENHFLKLNSDNEAIDKPIENHLTSPIKNNSPQLTQNSQSQSISQIHNNKPTEKVQKEESITSLPCVPNNNNGSNNINLMEKMGKSSHKKKSKMVAGNIASNSSNEIAHNHKLPSNVDKYDVPVNNRGRKHVKHKNKNTRIITKKSQLKDTKKYNDNSRQNNFSISTVSTSIANIKSTNMKQEKTTEKNNPVNLLKQINKINDKSENIQKSYNNKKKMILKDSALNNSPSIIKDAKICVSETVLGPSFYQTKTLKSILQKNQHSSSNQPNYTDRPQIVEIANNKIEQKVSVPKIVSNCTIAQLPIQSISELKKDVISTINEPNNKIQKTIAQNIQNPQLQEMKPIRKKLNLTEYRKHRSKHNNYDNTATVIYINHSSTTTEAIKHNPDNPVWVERFTVLQRQSERGIKPLSHDKEIQTNETSLGFPKKSIIDFTKHENNKEKETDAEKSQCNEQKRSSNLSRTSLKDQSKRNKSRSRSRSQNLDEHRCRSRNRNRNPGRKRNKYRNRSRSQSRNSRNSSSSSSSRGSTYNRNRSRSRSYEKNVRRDIYRRNHVTSNNESSSYSHQSTSRNSSFYSRSRRSRSRSSSRYYPNPKKYRKEVRANEEKQKQANERRVVYLGGLSNEITKSELRHRFEIFGPIENISIYFRERSHNYGFITFMYKEDANNAVDHGNDDPSLPRYEINFGGRRAFCDSIYSDLDNVNTGTNRSYKDRLSGMEWDNLFDSLLERIT